jgi:beta-lactamase class A
MVANKTGADLIRAGLPNGWKIGDKTGRGGHNATNDVAIIRPPGKSPILLSIYFVDSTAPPEARNAALADVARLVVHGF